MKLGITGTREGLTEKQKLAVRSIFESRINYVKELHHGLCVGADAEVHDIARQHAARALKIVGHPPLNPFHLQYKECDEMRDCEEYLKRNQAIVNETDCLLALPAGPEVRRSGTWSTVRHARRAGKPITIVMPDGTRIAEE